MCIRDRPSDDQCLVVDDLGEETGCEREDDEIFFFEKEELPDPCCESVFHPCDVDAICLLYNIL